MKVKLKRFGVFGDTASYEYNFGLKVANSMAECPMKLFQGLIDPANPPAPTDTTWKEITSQAVLDKIKSQNELNITSVDTTGRTAVWNGQTLVQQGTNNPAVRDDFAGKTAGSTTGNPHIASARTTLTSLNPPTGGSVWTELNDASIGYINTQNGSSLPMQSTGVGQIPQILFSFNIIRMIEDKYGLIPVDRTGTASEVMARQVQWCKDNFATGGIAISWYGYGICPTGNKAYLVPFLDGSWWTPWLNNTSVTSTKLSSTIAPSKIDSNGFIHFLAYTDPARTTDSTLLVLTGHGLSNYDIVENITKNTTIVITKGTNDTLTTSTVAGQTSGDVINKYKYSTNKNSVAGTNETTVVITNHGLATGDYVKNVNRNYTVRKVTVIDANTFTASSVTGQVAGDTFQLYPLLGTQTAESTVIPSTIYTDYVSLDLQLKPTAGYDVLVPSNPRRDAGLGNVVQLQKIYAKQVSDFAGKVAGSTTENPNKAYRISSSTSLAIPNSGYTEFDDSRYTGVKTLNDASATGTGSALTSEAYGQHLFSFDLISIFEKQYGTIPITLTGNADTDKANKIAWLKSGNGISKLTVKWYGYGSCPSGNKARMHYWYNGAWFTDASREKTYSSPNQIALVWSGAEISNAITSDGFAHILASTDASDGVTASTIYTDYISLDIEYNAPNNSVEYFTNNSVELESLTNAKAQAYMVECDMTALCQAVAGGSNSAFKSLLKSIQADVWAMGSGANAGVLGYGVTTSLWRSDTLVWFESVARISSAIQNNSYNSNNINVIKLEIDTANKLYFLVRATYPSDGTIPSQVSLDYINIKVELTRQPDTVAPISVNLSQRWAMLVKGFSPSWDNASTPKAVLYLTRNGDKETLRSYISNGSLSFQRYYNTLVDSAAITIANVRYQCINILHVVTDTQVNVYALSNNGTLKKGTAVKGDLTNLSGLFRLYILMYSASLRADAFADSFRLIDLDKIGKPTGFTDAEATAMLNGTAAGYENPELLNKTLSTTQTVKVLPNNRFELKTNKSATVKEKYNNIVIKTSTYAADTTFVTDKNTNNIQIDTIGDFSTISLKRKD